MSKLTCSCCRSVLDVVDSGHLDLDLLTEVFCWVQCYTGPDGGFHEKDAEAT